MHDAHLSQFLTSGFLRAIPLQTAHIVHIAQYGDTLSSYFILLDSMMYRSCSPSRRLERNCASHGRRNRWNPGLQSVRVARYR
jgi:hypothetical protein